MRIDNIEEACVGGMVGAAFCYILGWWSLLTIPACAVLWWLGGADGFSKGWRRVGVPIVLALFLSIALRSFWPVLGGCIMFPVLTIGYGLPSYGDAGSPLGRFVCKLFNLDPVNYPEDQTRADIVVRGIIGFLMGMSWFVIAPLELTGWVAGVGIMTICFPLIVVVVE